MELNGCYGININYKTLVIPILTAFAFIINVSIAVRIEIGNALELTFVP